MNPPQGGSAGCSMDIYTNPHQYEQGTIWTSLSAHQGSSNQKLVSNDYVLLEFLPNWNCHHNFPHLHSEAGTQIMHHDMWEMGRKKDREGRESVKGTQGRRKKKQEEENLRVLIRCDRCKMHHNLSDVRCQVQ